MRRKRIVLASIFSIIAATNIATIATSLAGFFSAAVVEQTVEANGKLGESIFLEPGLWDVDNPTYMVYVWNNSGNQWISSSKKNSAGYYVFLVQTSVYTNMVFARMNPSGSLDSFDNGVCWNKTGDLTYSSSKNVYHITGWGNSGSWDYGRTISTGYWDNTKYTNNS